MPGNGGKVLGRKHGGAERPKHEQNNCESEAFREPENMLLDPLHATQESVRRGSFRQSTPSLHFALPGTSGEEDTLFSMANCECLLWAGEISAIWILSPFLHLPASWLRAFLAVACRGCRL